MIDCRWGDAHSPLSLLGLDERVEDGTMETMNLTSLELAFLKSVVDHDEYGERGCLDNRPWSWAVCGTRSQAAVLGSLVKKGLMGQEGRGRDASCYLTDMGKRAYLHYFGPGGTWTSS